MTDKVRGYVDYIFYPKTGLDKKKNLQIAGFNIKTQNPTKVIKCFGKVPLLKPGDYFEFEGTFTDQKSFSVDSALRVDDDTLGATSMLIYIFGPKTAQKVLKSFNDDALTCLDTFKNHESAFADKMKSVRGLGPKTIENAYIKYEKHIAVDILFNKFSRFGLILNKALKVYNLWGDQSLKKIEENPYQLQKVGGISFSVMDCIAIDYYHYSTYDERRIEAAAMHVMSLIQTMGHVFIRISPAKNTNYDDLSLVGELKKMLNLSESIIREAIVRLINQGKLIKERQGFFEIVYTPDIYHAEKSVAKYLKERIGKTTCDESYVRDFIHQYEKQNFQLAEKQKEAILMATTNRFGIISGPPGSGKTTIIDVICKIMESKQKNCRIKLAAPTGKASKRISESTGRKAETVHRLLKYNPVDEQFEYNDKNPLPADVLIVDEVSMMPLTLTYQLLQAVPQNAILLFVGDKDQLPSVQEGKILEDLLAVPFIPKTVLNEIYRQKKGSTLLDKALEVSKGHVPNLENEVDFTFVEESNLLELQKKIQEKFFEKLKKYALEDILLLSPQNKGEIGVESLNECIQERYNPMAEGKPEMKSGKRVFRVGDRVIQLVNEDEFSVYNGMVGTIVDIVNEDSTLGVKDAIYVDYGEDEISEYTRDRFDNLKLAYALTIHKSQGSEAKCVLMVVHEAHKNMLRKKILYTGMTRAKDELIFLGQKNMIENAVLRNKEPNRNTKLKYWLSK